MRTSGNMAPIGALDYWKMRNWGHMKGGKFSSIVVFLLDLGEYEDKS